MGHAQRLSITAHLNVQQVEIPRSKPGQREGDLRDKKNIAACIQAYTEINPLAGLQKVPSPSVV